jgi:hypothetical protein
MKLLPPVDRPRQERESESARPLRPQGKVKDPALQDWFSPLVMPATIQNFEGINTGSIPPDTNGDVGPNHYVQWVNTSFAVYNKSGGLIFGPAAGNSIWSGFGGPCQTTNDGDPIVLYDPIADRWLFSQLGNVFTAGPYHQCVAVSQTSNPTGPYFRYDFIISNTQLNDYPKFGVWPDAYYMTANQFSGSSFVGPAAVAFDRTRMLSGLSATMLKFDQTNSVLTSQYFGMLPSDLDGPTQPPAGSPNYLVTWDGPFLSRLYLFKYHVDWVTPGNSNVTGPTQLVTAAFTQLCNSCVSQPGTGQSLDTLAQDTMYRLAYRNFGTNESLVTNHSVDAGGRAGVRWYEIRSPNTSPTIFQQGTYSPDTDHRWMGSIAMDHSGDMAMGFSVSSSGTFPSIRYAGRLVGDPLGTMGQGEATLIAGSGSQTVGARWGDYSMMSVDPVDDCTFWYTTEYIQTTGGGWRTRIGSFKFPSCTFTTPTTTPTATRTSTATPTRTSTPSPSPTPSPTPTNISNTAFARFEPPGPASISVGSRLDLELWVESGGNSVNVAQHYLTFTYGIIQLVNVNLSGCVLTSTVTADIFTFDAVLQNETCNGPAGCVFRGSPVGPGSFAFASGALNNGPTIGDFRVARTAWCAIAPGDAVLHWQFSPPDPIERDTEVVDEFGNLVQNPTLYTDYVIHVVAATATRTSTATPTSTAIPTNTATFTNTPTVTSTPTPNTALFVGHVTWQGPPAQPNVKQQQSVTLTLKLGAAEVNYPTQNTDSSGFFTVSVAGMPAGTYNWRVKGPKYLANAGTVGLAGASQTNAEMGLMKVGDCDNNNVINVGDFNILKNTFGKSLGQPGYDARADFNADDVVNVNDFNFQKNNFGQAGSPAIRPLQP